MSRDLSSLPYPVRLCFEQRQVRGDWVMGRYRCENEGVLRERIVGVDQRADMRVVGVEVGGVIVPVSEFRME